MPDPDLTRLHVSRVRVEKLARLLDGVVRVPGTRFRFGLDSIIGLIPGVGDVAGLLLGSVIFYESLRAGAPRSLIARMLGNSLVDAVGGLIPGVGDLFDVAFKSNARNARLLIEHLDGIQTQATAPVQGSRLLAIALVLLFLVAAAVPLALFWTWWFRR